MLAINIPADGLFLAVQNKADGDFSQSRCENIIEDYIDKFLQAKPDIILLNVCYRRSLTPSEVFDSYLYNIETDENGYAKKDENGKTIKTFSPVTKQEVSKYFSSLLLCGRSLLNSQIDIYKTAVQKIKNAGCKVFLSVRMNDGHYTENVGINSSFALKNGSEYTIEKNGYALNFSLKAVQNYFCQYIEELVSNYEVDGIELDWLRFPTVLPQNLCSDFSILNEYMRRIRTLLNRHDKDLDLAVRVLANEEDNLGNGVDVCQWIADGSVNIVTIENFYIPTNYELPVSEWQEHIERRNTHRLPYKIFCGTDWAVSCVRRYNIAMTPSLVRGFVDTCYQKGADGVYLFNFFEENGTSSLELIVDEKGEASLKNCFLSRLKAANEWDTFPRRYIHIGASNNRYPILLQAGETYNFQSQIKGSFGNVKVTVGLDRDERVAVFFNQSSAQFFMKTEQCIAGFEYISEAEIEKDSEFIYSVSQAAPCIKTLSFLRSAFEDGEIKIGVKNESLKPLKILWLEISFET